MQAVFSTPESMKKDFRYTFCPGCDHGIAVRLVAELIDELNLRENTICSTCVGCSVFLYDFINIDCVEAPHGRACASATGVKRTNPDKFVFTYQGDGDFASIGYAESMHTAIRGENISAICINNTTLKNTLFIRQIIISVFKEIEYLNNPKVYSKKSKLIKKLMDHDIKMS